MKTRKHTLLMVEDDEDQRFFFQRAFEALGTQYKVQLATNGNEAIAYFKGEGKYADRKAFEFPSYVLTDLQMRDGDGFHVLDS
jgi:CheY-like chemotaxis protein